MKTLSQKIEEKIVRIPFSGCWIWTGYRNRTDYGLISFGSYQHRAWKMAHRVSWELKNGPIPQGLIACHICDIPACVNPDHLFIGTDRDNVHDSMRKGRFHKAIGEKATKAKLTAEQVLEIRADGRTSYFAKKYGVALSTIKRVKSRKSWKHI